MIAVDLAEGQRNDAPLALPVLAEAASTLGRIDQVLGDKGLDSDAIRGAILEDHDALPVIPNKRNRKEPWPWDEVMAETYKQRNRIEGRSPRRGNSGGLPPATRSERTCISAWCG